MTASLPTPSSPARRTSFSAPAPSSIARLSSPSSQRARTLLRSFCRADLSWIWRCGNRLCLARLRRFATRDSTDSEQPRLPRTVSEGNREGGLAKRGGGHRGLPLYKCVRRPRPGRRAARVGAARLPGFRRRPEWVPGWRGSGGRGMVVEAGSRPCQAISARLLMCHRPAHGLVPAQARRSTSSRPIGRRFEYMEEAPQAIQQGIVVARDPSSRTTIPADWSGRTAAPGRSRGRGWISTLPHHGKRRTAPRRSPPLMPWS